MWVWRRERRWCWPCSHSRTRAVTVFTPPFSPQGDHSWHLLKDVRSVSLVGKSFLYDGKLRIVRVVKNWPAFLILLHLVTRMSEQWSHNTMYGYKWSHCVNECCTTTEWKLKLYDYNVTEYVRKEQVKCLVPEGENNGWPSANVFDWTGLFLNINHGKEIRARVSYPQASPG